MALQKFDARFDHLPNSVWTEITQIDELKATHRYPFQKNTVKMNQSGRG